MRLSTARAKQIDDYIATNPDAKIADKSDQKSHVHIKGKLQYLDVFRLPTDNLIYNIRNGRFRAELIAKEAELKRHLDPTDKADAKLIQKLLLEQNESETSALKADLIRDGQLVPGIITFDGAVINANRRMAILSFLYKETGDRKYQYLIVGRLPQGVDESDLWRIEAELQFGRDFRLEYGGVNELLKLKEGTKQGLSEKHISIALKGRYSEGQVIQKLEVLKLVESYLEFIGRPLDYNTIQEGGLLEKFISLHTALAPLRKQKRNKEMADLTAWNFVAISKTKIKHLDIRKSKDIADNKEAYKELMKSFNPRKPFSTSPSLIEEAFDSALDIVKSKNESDKPVKLLRKALSAVDSIDEKNVKLKEAGVKELLESLAVRIAKLQKAARR